MFIVAERSLVCVLTYLSRVCDIKCLISAKEDIFLHKYKILLFNWDNTISP